MERRIHDFIPYIKDLYTINDKGEIYSDNCGKMKTRNKSKTGYQIINFMKEDGTKKTFRVHRLVMMAFSPIKNSEKMEVNHIDGDKKNNNFDNLEWCTPSENQKHAVRLGLQKTRCGEDSNLSKLTRNEVETIFDLYEDGRPVSDIARKIGCSSSNVSCILTGKSWKQIYVQRLCRKAV